MSEDQSGAMEKDAILERLETKYSSAEVVIYRFVGMDVTLDVGWILKTYRALSPGRRSSMNDSIRLGE